MQISVTITIIQFTTYLTSFNTCAFLFTQSLKSYNTFLFTWITPPLNSSNTFFTMSLYLANTFKSFNTSIFMFFLTMLIIPFLILILASFLSARATVMVRPPVAAIVQFPPRIQLQSPSQSWSQAPLPWTAGPMPDTLGQDKDHSVTINMRTRTLSKHLHVHVLVPM